MLQDRDFNVIFFAFKFSNNFLLFIYYKFITEFKLWVWEYDSIFMIFFSLEIGEGQGINRFLKFYFNFLLR